MIKTIYKWQCPMCQQILSGESREELEQLKGFHLEYCGEPSKWEHKTDLQVPKPTEIHEIWI